ncbi:unnamed protein product [Linum trigynum]|uniref:Uncharacterized protein n=1 Tax=Linum trigynum TaxID=586398 RepID=A0AAV2CFT8_9ROSI
MLCPFLLYQLHCPSSDHLLSAYGLARIPMPLLQSSLETPPSQLVSSSLRFAFPYNKSMSSFCFYSDVLSPPVGYDCTWWETNGSLLSPTIIPQRNPKSFLAAGRHGTRT